MYSIPVKFKKTNLYGCGPENHDDVYTVEEFINCCKRSSFIDYDGHGYPVKNSLADETICIKPSRFNAIPEDATHIVWYNR